MKQEYKEKTSRVLTLRLRERRSATKQLTYFGPMGLLQQTLDEVATIIKDLPPKEEEQEDEEEKKPPGKGKGKGKPKKGKGAPQQQQ